MEPRLFINDPNDAALVQILCLRAGTAVDRNPEALDLTRDEAFFVSEQMFEMAEECARQFIGRIYNFSGVADPFSPPIVVTDKTDLIMVTGALVLGVGQTTYGNARVACLLESLREDAETLGVPFDVPWITMLSCHLNH